MVLALLFTACWFFGGGGWRRSGPTGAGCLADRVRQGGPGAW